MSKVNWDIVDTEHGRIFTADEFNMDMLIPGEYYLVTLDCKGRGTIMTIHLAPATDKNSAMALGEALDRWLINQYSEYSPGYVSLIEALGGKGTNKACSVKTINYKDIGSMLDYKNVVPDTLTVTPLQDGSTHVRIMLLNFVITHSYNESLLKPGHYYSIFYNANTKRVATVDMTNKFNVMLLPEDAIFDLVPYMRGVHNWGNDDFISFKVNAINGSDISYTMLSFGDFDELRQELAKL